MSDDDNWTIKIDNEILSWVLENSNDIEAITPRMLIKISDIKTNEPESCQEMANIKFGI